MATKKTPKASTKKKTAATKPAATKTVAKKAASIETELDPSLEWSLEEVEPHLKPVPEEKIARMRASIVRALSEPELIAIGASHTSEDIIAAAPPFIIGALLAIAKHGAPISGLADAFLPLLVREAGQLGEFNSRYEQEHRDVSTTISRRREKLKVANGKALSKRRAVAQTLIRYVVPASDSPRRVQLEAAAAGAKTYAETVASTRTVARILSELRKDAQLKPVLDDFGYTDEVVAELNALAADVDTQSKQGAGLRPPQKTSQRALDLQDGLVLSIMRAIWDALREARADGASFGLPPVGRLERFFSISTSTVEDTGEQEADPATDDVDADDEDGDPTLV